MAERISSRKLLMKTLLLIIRYAITMAAGFAARIHALPILTAPAASSNIPGPRTPHV